MSLSSTASYSNRFTSRRTPPPTFEWQLPDGLCHVPQIRYNVWRIKFKEPTSGYENVAIAIVPENHPIQNIGTVHICVSWPANGDPSIRYERLPDYEFTQEPAFHSQSYLFNISERSVAAWEAVIPSVPLPTDPITPGYWHRNFLPREPQNWVADVLRLAWNFPTE